MVVTGGGTGLGKAIALEFARPGARLVIAVVPVREQMGRPPFDTGG